MSDPLVSFPRPSGKPLDRHLFSGRPGVEKEAMVDRDKMLDVTLQQIEKQFGKGAVMKLGEHPAGAGVSGHPHGLVGPRPRARCGRHPARARDRDLRTRGFGQDHGQPAHHRRGAEPTVASPPSSTPNTRSTPPMRVSSGVNIDELLVSQPDSGEQALEIADMLVRSGSPRPRGHRLRRRPGTPGRDRRRDGRYPRGPAGPAHEPGHAQALGHRCPSSTPPPSSSTSSARRSA